MYRANTFSTLHSAVAAAADALAHRLRTQAALRANCAPEDLTLADENVLRPDGTPVCRIADLLADPLSETGKVQPTQAFASGCHVAEIAIDRMTGAATLMRYVAVDDAGDHRAERDPPRHPTAR